MKPCERLIMEIVRKGPIPLSDLCERAAIAPSNIRKYTNRLERAHQIVIRASMVDGEMCDVVFHKRGHFMDNDPETSAEVGDPTW